MMEQNQKRWKSDRLPLNKSNWEPKKKHLNENHVLDQFILVSTLRLDYRVRKSKRHIL